MRPTILIVGAADTGRAPMAAALLRRQIEQRRLPWDVASAGVVGHDDDPPEPEARTTMLHMGLNIDQHHARSVGEDMLAEAALVLAVDSGTARAMRARFAGVALHTLGDLAGRARDIPDPFRMQVGAWMTYARELEAMLIAALDRIRELLGEPPAAPQPPPALAGATAREAALGRAARLLALLADMPEVVRWDAARARLEAELDAATAPLAPGDLAKAYGGLLRAALALSAPSPGQARRLAEAYARLAQPAAQADIDWLSAQIGGWAAL